MVFEGLLTAEKAERKPLKAFLLSFILCTVAIMLSIIVFTPYLIINILLGGYVLFFIAFVLFSSRLKFELHSFGISVLILSVITLVFLGVLDTQMRGLDYAPYGTSMSLAIIFFAALGLAPFMVRILQVEERKDIQDLAESFLERHKEVLAIYTFLFLGAIIAYSLWFTILPQPLVDVIFSEQLATLNWVASVRSGLVVGLSTSQKLGLSVIVANNLKVLAVATLLSFALGSGAIFILTWNASVIAVAIGDSARRLISYYADLGEFASLAAYFHALPVSFSRLIFHGSLEIIAYFIGGLAGGILSVAVLRHQGKATRRVMLDAAMLLGVAVVLIAIAAGIEVAIMGL